MGGVAGVSLSLAVLGSSRFGPTGLLGLLLGFYSPLARSWEFAAGALLALMISNHTAISRNLATAAGLSGILVLSASVWSITRTTPFPSIWTLLPVVGTVLLIFAGTNESNVVSRALAGRLMVKLGDWSYSIYLWHWPFIVFARFVWPDNAWAILIASALSVFPAVASYKWVEQPIRSYQGLSRLQFTALVAGVVMPPLLFGGGLWQGARTLFWHESALAMASKTAMPTGWSYPLCISKIPVNKRDVKECQWQSGASGLPIYLVGDSNAMHFSEAIRNAGLALHRPITALGSDGCPLIDVFFRLKSDPHFMMQCRDDYTAMMDWLARNSPGLVIIGSVDRYWWDQNYRIRDSGSSKDADPNLNAKMLDEGLERTVRRLKKAGHSVLLLQTIPHYIVPPYTAATIQCTGWMALQGSCRQVSEIPLKVTNELQKASREGIANVATKTGAAVLDFRSYFCAQERCSTRINGIDMYMPDGYHLNKGGSAALTEMFIAQIKSLKAAVSMDTIRH